MGVWGSGLYSGDFALELRSAVRCAARLPLDGDELVEVLISLEPRAANHPEDEDHTTFWLVVADQFARLGIVSDRARLQALQIIGDGSDIAMLTKLGMDTSGAKKRQKMLADLRRSLLTVAQAGKTRRVVKKKQPLVMNEGDVFVYPTSLGRCKVPLPAWMHVVPAWELDGWNAVVIVGAERAFDFLVWYHPLILARPVTEKPDLLQLQSAPLWILKRPCICTAILLRRLGMEKIAAVRVDSVKLRHSFPLLASGIKAVIANRSLDSELTVGSQVGQSYISEKALQKTPNGLRQLPDLIRKANERYEKLQGLRPKGLENRQDPTISSLNEILS